MSGEDGEKCFQLCKFEEYPFELENTAESHSTVFIDSDDLIESFDDIWEYFRPLGQTLSEGEREEAHEALVAFCENKVMAIEDDDKRWYRVKMEQSDLRTVLPIYIFRDWFLNFMADISPVIERHVVARIDSSSDYDESGSLLDDYANLVLLYLTESPNNSFCNQHSPRVQPLIDDDNPSTDTLSSLFHEFSSPASPLVDEESLGYTQDSSNVINLSTQLFQNLDLSALPIEDDDTSSDYDRLPKMNHSSRPLNELSRSASSFHM
jgi:hypothetical protein